MYRGSIGARWHGPDDDCLKIIDVSNKQVLHTFEEADREGPRDVGIHVASYGIRKHGKAEHILHGTDFFGGDVLSTLACAAIMLDCMLLVEAVLAQ